MVSIDLGRQPQILVPFSMNFVVHRAKHAKYECAETGSRTKQNLHLFMPRSKAVQDHAKET